MNAEKCREKFAMGPVYSCGQWNFKWPIIIKLKVKHWIILCYLFSLCLIFRLSGQLRHKETTKAVTSDKCKLPHAVPWVVEEPGIPQGMHSSGTSMKVTRVRAIKFIEAIHHILWGMGMDNIQEYKQAHWVSSINKLFKFFRCAIPATREKKGYDY